MNLSLVDVKGAALIVSQFTLFADFSRGRRPSLLKAGDPDGESVHLLDGATIDQGSPHAVMVARACS